MSPITSLVFFLVVGSAVAAPQYPPPFRTDQFQQVGAPFSPVFLNPLELGVQAPVDKVGSEQVVSGQEEIGTGCAASLNE